MKTAFLLENYESILMLLFGTGGGGFFGWYFSMKSKKLEFHEKAFQINSEMIDAIKADFLGRIKFLSDMIEESDRIIKEQNQVLKEHKEHIAQLHIELESLKAINQEKV
ncbi:hypothetical protein G1K75_09605 [Tenacibaculum finnmarkense]|uniref:hypothetical protein n=1 Tax=Tenacibaculum finnmarkense TaxID=2781243 RepID=UPI001E5D1892|nr:hypothetical protein [Tenacibaculum finnmarkense]MCD8405783.1 hypothetical protein [Tenacibaculum dicentrarchi]MCD8425555.1 hypothetical protein [Tenacibaculum dicentrarchi]MCG8805910.1 hypothetical protein [Tenacibaculum finnmarkense]MCG8838582.1 hypothetical protein [Tenacibaculum dicentrarchi]